MEMADRMRDILKKEYGIHSDDELRTKLKEEKIDIGLFTKSPQSQNEEVS